MKKPYLAEIDQAILELQRGPGAFTQAKLRDQLKVQPGGPEAKNIANRLHMLLTQGVLKTEGEYKRNRMYFLVKSKAEAFARRVKSNQPVVSNGRVRTVSDAAAIKRSTRLAELDDLKPSLQNLTAKIDRIENMVTKLHAVWCLEEPTRSAQPSEQNAGS
jgi:hypothetical protein